MANRDTQADRLTSWFTILTLRPMGNPPSMTAIPGEVHQRQHTLLGLTNTGALAQQGVEEAMSGLEETYTYSNKILISMSTREAHSATL